MRRLLIPAARVRGARFAPGGAAIDYVSDQGGQYERLLQLDEASGRVRALSARAPWSVEQFAASPNGHYIAYTLDDDGHSVLHVLNRQLRLDVAMPWLHDGVIGNLQFDSGHRLGFTFQSGWQPPEAYVYDLRGGLVRRWTRGTADTRATAAPAAGRLIHYPTWDRVDGH
ncbi:peptidase S9 prolyl oligopeptidase active site domain protein, partial [mine drainage metagenome]